MYVAETVLPSGLVAVIFSTIIFFNGFFSKLFFGNALKKNVIIGGIIGVLGLGILLSKDLFPIHFDNRKFLLFVICIISSVLASLGSMVAIKNKRLGLSVLQTNAYGMFYGGLIMLLLVVLTRRPIVYEYTVSYTISLFYLALFGSIVGFSCYLVLMHNIGPTKSAYIALVIPVVAMAISTFFEAYQWTWQAISGMFIIASGIYIALRPAKNSS